MRIGTLLKKIGIGYSLLLRKLAFGLGFLLLLGVFNYLVFYPLRSLAVNQRLIFNILALSAIGLLLIAGLIRLILKIGLKQSLVALVVLVLFVLQLTISGTLNSVGVLFACLFLLMVQILSMKKQLLGGRLLFFLLLAFINGFYRISIGIMRGNLWLVIPAGLYFLGFLGLIMYENLNSTRQIDI